MSENAEELDAVAEEKAMLLPYFQERYTGKQCVLCNLGERSQLGQGEMLRFDVGDRLDGDDEEMKDLSGVDVKVCEENANPLMFMNKRQKGVNKCK